MKPTRLSLIAIGITILLGLLCFAHGLDPDVGLNMEEIVRQRGYPIESYKVTTEDGFILGMFRIPHGLVQSSNNAVKPVVLLQHGLLDSSYTWVNNFANESLAYILADQGFDVWMSNSRGNTWSRHHTHLNTDDNAFWNFTYDDMARFDLPANIDFVLHETGAKSLSYVGHSQGTMQDFVGFSLADYSSRVNLFVGLAPVTYVYHQKSYVFKMLAYMRMGLLFKFFGIHEFLPTNVFMEKLAPYICDYAPLECNDLIYMLCGKTFNLNATRLEVYTSQTPAGTSVKNMLHWSQGIQKEVYQRFDYGCNMFSCKNKQIYGQRTPPAYELENITVPMALFSGSHDELADKDDVKTLIQRLPMHLLRYYKEIAGYAHLDLVWAFNANTKLYPDVIRQIRLAIET